MSNLRGHVHVHPLDAGERLHGGEGLLLQHVLDRTGGGGQLDVEREGAGVDLHVLDETQADDVPAQIRILDRAEGVQDLLLADPTGGVFGAHI